MSLASDLRDRVSERQDANLEFADGGYRLSLNPIEDHYDELGFILWRDEVGGPAPVAAGRAVGDTLVLDTDVGVRPASSELDSMIRRLLGGEPVAVEPRRNPEDAVPTGG